VVEVPVISIIDDDASVRTATARLLRSMGFSVHAFASAKEFLSSPRLSETSCIIADVQMPGMSGVELQDHLIANGHKTPIIFITAFPQERVRSVTGTKLLRRKGKVHSSRISNPHIQ
jgi:FixJ family two-component response regulator